MDATCRNCPYWTKREDRPADDDLGLCHHVAAGPEVGDGDLSRRSDWFCSEHPLRQRDRLAAMAMQGWLASWPARTWLAGDPTQLAEHAYRTADAMLAAASRPVPGKEP